MSVYIATFDFFVKILPHVSFFSRKFTTIFFFSTVNLPQICFFTVLSAPICRKFITSFLSVSVVSLSQVFSFLSQICHKYVLFYHKVCPFLSQVYSNFTPFIASLPQVYRKFITFYRKPVPSLSHVCHQPTPFYRKVCRKLPFCHKSPAIGSILS